MTKDYRKLTPPTWIAEREADLEKHSAWVEDGVVKLANNDDGYYTETFKTRDEVELFVGYLLEKANEAWPDSSESNITFKTSQTEEVIRLDKEGFHYKGEFIADAGEAHQLMLKFLKQHTV